MLKAILGDHNLSVDVNDRMSLFAALYLGVIGPAVFIVQPAFVQGLVEQYGFSEQGAGYVASAEMWGIAISTLALTFFSNRVNWRDCLILAIVLAAVGNFVSTMTTDMTSFAVIRAITGIGSGVLVSLTFTIVGLTSNPDRNFGFMIMWILAYGAIGFLLMPLGFSMVGMAGVLIFFGLFNLSALPFVRYLPVSGEGHVQSGEGGAELSKNYKALAVVTLFVYFLAQGVVWAYLFLVGTGGGVTEQAVTNGLTVSQFFGVAGALTAAMMADRFGRIPPLFLGIAGSVISLLLLFGQMTPLVYGVAVCIFNYAWNKTHPFLLAALASFDRTGRMVVLGVAAQMLGLAIGPALAATVIGENGYSSILWLGIALFVASFITIVPPLLKQQTFKQQKV